MDNTDFCLNNGVVPKNHARINLCSYDG